ncbi:hypothetical protein [Sporosarcina sp. G11-34]|uniref:hypothetical protein n=1 Tax=Sporosarcina sp. G11-34 TaxID=2849605 RepID=UPI0022A96DE4|nr:hypothetical protein [Sporosarcina sp. G11-34]MCZ2260612.1 hypothetical protein [Sporosarcina sp. G11-34]
MKINDEVKIKDNNKVKNDPHLEDRALIIIAENNYKGVITKIVDGIHFVGFKNDLVWVTQGFKTNEIEVV